MAKMFAVFVTSFTPCECGSRESRNVEFVTSDEKVANDFVEEKMKARKETGSCWGAEYEVEEVEVR